MKKAVAGGMNNLDNLMQPKKVDLSNHQNIKHGKKGTFIVPCFAEIVCAIPYN
jgi:hypothetical protein